MDYWLFLSLVHILYHIHWKSIEHHQNIEATDHDTQRVAFTNYKDNRVES